jgi:hypothetical protein
MARYLNTEGEALFVDPSYITLLVFRNIKSRDTVYRVALSGLYP